MKPITFASLSPLKLGRGRARASILASVMTLGCALPISTALAESAPAGNGVLSVPDPSGGPTELANNVTLAQLASVLKITLPELIAELQAIPGNSTISALLNDLAANPNGTFQNVLDDMAANGLNPGLAEQTLASLLAPVVANSSELQGVAETLLSDLGLDGQLGSLASELSVPTSALENPNLAPVSPASLAGTLDTTIEHLSTLLAGVGASTQPLTSITPLIAAPLPGTGGVTTEIIAVPDGVGGITLTPVSSTPGASGPAGATGQPGASGASSATTPATPATPIPNAYSIVSIKLTKSGLIVETVKLPNAGRLTIKVTAKGIVASASKHGRTKSTSRAIKVAPVTANVGAGTRTITLRPARAIKTARHIVVSVTTTYAPTGGAANTQHKSVTFAGPTKSKAKRKS
jgi:hypothetical protein